MGADKKVLAVIFPKGTQDQVLTPDVIADMNARYDVRWPGDGPISAEQGAELLKDADAAMSGWGVFNGAREALLKTEKLKIVAHSAGSVKMFTSDELFDKGIIVTQCAHSIAVDVAHYAIGLIIVGFKNVMEIAPQVKAGKWRGYQARKATELRDATVGIIAASHVGRNVMELLKPFDCNVLLYDPFCPDDKAKAMGATKVTDLKELFARSDAVSVHAPKLPETDKMVNAEMLGAMKDGALLINTSRGSIIDEKALVSELQKKRIWAFLDVTDPEPPVEGSPLYACRNLTLTPHIAGSSQRGRLRLGREALNEIDRLFAGEQVKYAVTKDMLARIG